MLIVRSTLRTTLTVAEDDGVCPPVFGVVTLAVAVLVNDPTGASELTRSTSLTLLAAAVVPAGTTPFGKQVSAPPAKLHALPPRMPVPLNETNVVLAGIVSLKPLAPSSASLGPAFEIEIV